MALHEADLESVLAAEEKVATLEDALGRSRREIAAAKQDCRRHRRSNSRCRVDF